MRDTSTHGGGEPVTVGRTEESAALRAALPTPESGGRAVLVAGDAGMGKTTLVAAVRREAEDGGCQVLFCAGRQDAGTLAFEALQELLRPLLPLVDALPERQRAAVSTAFGLGEESTPNQLLMSLGVLGLLEEAASRRPVLVVVEDLQWLDAATLAVLRFLSRRLGRAAITLVMTARTSSPAVDVPWMPAELVVELAPLTAEESGFLLDAVDQRLPEFQREQVLRVAAGNPLALRELPAVRGAVGDGGPTRNPDRVPVTERLERAFTAAADGLPAASRRLLVVASAGHELSVGEAAGVLRRLGAAPADLDPLERSGLLTLVAGRWRFRHPLVSSAVYWAAPAAERVAAHEVLAEVLAEIGLDPARAVWHRAASVTGTDEAVAAQLERAGATAAGRGAPQEAATAFHRAAELSAQTQDRVRRLAWSASMSRQTGQHAVAARTLDEARPLAVDPFTATSLATTELGLHIMAATPARSTTELLALVRELGGADGTQAARERTELLWAMALRCAVRPTGDEADAAAVLAELRAADPTAAPTARSIALALLDPLTHHDVRTELPALLGHVRTDPRALLSLGIAAEQLQDLPSALAAWVASTDELRRNGSAADQAQTLTLLARVRTVLGELTAARADVDLALQVAALNITVGGGPLLASAYAAQALGAAWQGRDEQALAAAARSRDPAGAPHLQDRATASWAAGLVALTRQRHDEALRFLADTAVHPTTAAWASADLVETAVARGALDTARAALSALEDVVARLDSPHLRMLLHRGRAFLAEGAETEAEFTASIGHGRRSGASLELARSRLSYGEWLRRNRRVLDARPHLVDALDGFERAGALPWAERAGRELRASGVGAGDGRPAGVLTEQERQIAELAASGMTNKQIADEVYLSHRTVGAHLYRIFPKLGITSRRQLQEVVAPESRD